MASSEILSEGKFRNTEEMIGRVVDSLNNPDVMATPVSLEELIAASKKSNPLETNTSNHIITISGPVEKYKGGMNWKCTKSHVKTFLRPTETLDPVIRTKLKEQGISELDGRIGSGEHAIILKAVEKMISNNYPFPLAVVVSGIPGSSYVQLTPNKSIMCAVVIPPSTSAIVKDNVIHEMKATEDLYDAFFYKGITEDKLRHDIVDLPGHPGMCILKSCENSHIARELANPENRDELVEQGFDPSSAEVTQQAGLHKIGGVLCFDKKHAEWAVNKVLQRKQEHDNVVTTTNLSELQISFVPVGVESWANIEEHACFEGLTPEERAIQMKDPCHNVTWEMNLEHTFKDDYLLKKVRGN